MISQIAICVFKKQNFNHEIEHLENTLFGTDTYSFLTDIEGLKKGDILVAETKYGIGIVQFIRYSKSLSDKERADKWLIQKVDLTKHNERKEKMRLKEELIEEMRALRDSSMEIELFAKLAQSSPEMAKLLEKFNTL